MATVEELYQGMEYWWGECRKRLAEFEAARLVKDAPNATQEDMNAFHAARQRLNIAQGAWLEANKLLVEAMNKRKG